MDEKQSPQERVSALDLERKFIQEGPEGFLQYLDKTGLIMEDEAARLTYNRLKAAAEESIFGMTELKKYPLLPEEAFQKEDKAEEEVEYVGEPDSNDGLQQPGKEESLDADQESNPETAQP
jgi:hypothetical protein